MLSLLLLSICFHTTWTHESISEECPEPYGFYADAIQCDKYYECSNYTIKEKLCDDGLVFADIHPRVERCDFPFNVDCKDRPELQKPKGSGDCPRMNGYFANPDETVCNRFFFCHAGSPSEITCPEGLIFDLKSGTCDYPEKAARPGCGAEKVADFTCPEHSFGPGMLDHPRYPHPSDCQFFYVCIDGKVPRKNGCNQGTVYNIETKQCDDPENVPDCEDWYNEDKQRRRKRGLFRRAL